MKILLLYMPVVHKGYLDFIEEVSPAGVVLLAETVLTALPENLAYIAKKDVIRAVSVARMAQILRALYPAREVSVAGFAELAWMASAHSVAICMPAEDVSEAVAKQFLPGRQVTFLPTPKLRYNRKNVEQEKIIVPDRRTNIAVIERELMGEAVTLSQQSPDWWRQVGGVLVTKDGTVIVGWNEHIPHEQIASVFGDPRSLFTSGVRTDLSFSDHVEHVVIGMAAERGISTKGATLFCSTFPCLHCARLVVRSGVSRLFYRDPSYGLLDIDQAFKGKVELIEVN
jgi:dCMP deaminase